jgi:orotidine-5'-phosphate decarboxylase
MNARQKLEKANLNNKFICLGLDTDFAKIPDHLRSSKNPVVEFNRRIVESTKNSCAAYKINLAFYEKDGIAGLKNLEDTLSFIPSEVLTIGDGKRADIGNTSKMYAKSLFEHYNFDSATLNPLMGKDSLQPFLDYGEKLNFILALTSNTGSLDFQKLELKNGSFLYQQLIKKVLEWNQKLNCGIVFGATNVDELKANLDLIGNLPLLIPGVGAQGGSIEDVSRLLFTSNKNSFLVNISRGIIYKNSGENFAQAAADELSRLNDIVYKNKVSFA